MSTPEYSNSLFATRDLSLASRASTLYAALQSVEVTAGGGERLAVEDGLSRMMELLRGLRERKGVLYIVGNGGSAAVACHSTVDFLKVAGVRAVTLTDPSVLTAMANDISYSDAFAEMLKVHAQPGDAVVAISSSGRSANIVNAAAVADARGASVLTLSGFAPDNPLRSRGDFNVWVDSCDYGMVEAAHQFVLHVLIDRLWQERHT